MIKLSAVREVIALERFALIGIETPENEGEQERLLDRACEAVFGARFSDLPDAFFEEDEPWENPISQRAWAARRGYDLTDEFGQLLRHADEIAYMIEAVERGLIEPDPTILEEHKTSTWGATLEAQAKQFKQARR